MNLSLFNSLTRKKEEFVPIDQNLIKIYVCGPTVYDHPHIGNARSVVVYDILYRILINIYGFNHVIYIRNITDVDDKIIAKAKELNIPISEVTKTTTDYFHNDMDYIQCLRPNVSPKATEHIPEMIAMITILLEKNIAYEVDNHIYFDISKAPDYHLLSGRDFSQMLDGVRVENSINKRNPHDFVLWKPADSSDDIEANFDSPFGKGRPGWHIECSSMSHKYLGENFDIHGGGADLIFPHHTNEIAQSKCTFPGSKYSNIWVHNGFLTVNHEKMSKSLGNFITIHDLINKGIKGDVIRLFLLSNHYRKPLDYNDKAIEDSHKMLNYWYRAIDDIQNVNINNHHALPKDFKNALLDDMNITLAIKLINDYAKEVHLAKEDLDTNSQQIAATKLINSANFLGLMTESYDNWFNMKLNNKDQEAIQLMVTERIQAKNEKNWALADKIRNQLYNMGVTIEDKSDGTSVWKKEKTK